jgi:hypothetical protein
MRAHLGLSVGPIDEAGLGLTATFKHAVDDPTSDDCASPGEDLFVKRDGLYNAVGEALYRQKVHLLQLFVLRRRTHYVELALGMSR